MPRRLPPLPAIRAFEAAGRHLSFRRAAGELNVTPSAISHQVRGLEDWLGRPLFRRSPGGLVALTATGHRYLAELTGLLDGIDAATRSASARPDNRPFTLHCTPGFAARWLAPRLGRCPLGARIRITVSEGAPSTDFTSNGADLVIQWQADPVPGVVTRPLMESGQYPVCAPEVAARLPTPGALAGEVLIHDEVLDAWAEWFRLAGLEPPEMPRGPCFPHCELALTAAEQGQGVALAYDAMARDGLASGRLVRPFAIAVPPITIYSVAWPERHARCPDIRALADWLFAEVTAEGTRDRQPRPPARAAE